MRRGHPGRGGWRNENPRYFKPRTGPNPSFRPPRNYQQASADNPRFPAPHRFKFHRGSQNFGSHDDHSRSSYHEHGNYKPSHHDNHRSPDKTHHRHHYQDKRSDFRTDSEHSESSEYYQNRKQNEYYQVNNMGDIDQRQHNLPHNRYQVTPNQWSSWPNLSRHLTFVQNQENMTHDPTLPTQDYTGHRPPASDHYEAKTGSATDNSEAFSRSVDDTVDIIRKKLLSRNDPQNQIEPTTAQDKDERITRSEENSTVPSSQINSLEQTQKKRLQRSKHQSKNNNCNKLKDKIVNQLFKMDKDRIHKLIDNPISSSKFEFAIESLITQSQNSFNRHLRAAAEKSLYASRNDITQYNNEADTIYEDTFMKQMQHILDPQDSLFLEDMKPMVLAELNKVLQLNELGQQEDPSINMYDSQHESKDLEHVELYPYEGDCYTQNDVHTEPSVRDYKNTVNYHIDFSQDIDFRVHPESSTLFERRERRNSELNKSNSSDSNRRSSDNMRRSSHDSNIRLSLDKTYMNSEETPIYSHPAPYFEGNPDTITDDDDDTFAKLDQQYHVSVDHSLIELEDITNISSGHSDLSPSTRLKEENMSKICDEDMLINTSSSTAITDNEASKGNLRIEDSNEVILKAASLLLNNDKNELQSVLISDKANEKETVKESTKNSNASETHLDKSLLCSNSRKRSIDQRPSHRKEKRKKTESVSSDISKPISKNNLTNKSSEKTVPCSKSITTSNSKPEKDTIKDNKKHEISGSNNSEKHVKRKDSPQKAAKEKAFCEGKTKSNSYSHSTNNETGNVNNTKSINNKTGNKCKYKTIDMFLDKPKKNSLHQAHRNTAIPNTPKSTTIPDEKIKTIPIKHFGKQIVKRHVATQVINKMNTKETQTVDSKNTTTRFCQTINKKLLSKAVQTDVLLEKRISKTTDVLERMKEIDMELQELLQEKFKLYNSVESRDVCSNALGMAVVNVSAIESSKETIPEGVEEATSADAIIDDFTNIPSEELEQIALESVNVSTYDTPKPGRKSRQSLTELSRNSSRSPTTTRSRKVKTPNISLLEQIITDDRPIEDIIALDELETTPIKNRIARNKKKGGAKGKKAKQQDKQKQNECIIKECSVVLIREDFSKYIQPNQSTNSNTVVEEVQIVQNEVVSNVTEEIVVNDFQYDMLDVSEDIVIGENCELDSKQQESVPVPSSDDLVLDNSTPYHGNVEADTSEVQPVESYSTYDYAADEDLKHDSITVTGNGDAVLAIEFIENNFLAASLDGNVYYYSGNGQLLNTLRGSNLAVTCLTIVKEKYGVTVYTGSLDSRIRYYDLETGLEKGPECNVLSPIQTMDRAWDTVFVGTRTGFVLQFECKNNMLIPVSTIKFSDQSILALRALKEGPRKVLLVASRSENVTVKDAQTGLLLRTLNGPRMTVYTLLYESGKVYCGTSNSQIQVFDYASGSHVGWHEGGKGCVWLRAAGGLVWAGCYDGCVYVFRAGASHRQPLAQLKGPALMLLSLAVCGTKIVAGYKDKSLYIWKIPVNILKEMVL